MHTKCAGYGLSHVGQGTRRPAGRSLPGGAQFVRTSGGDHRCGFGGAETIGHPRRQRRGHPRHRPRGDPDSRIVPRHHVVAEAIPRRRSRRCLVCARVHRRSRGQRRGGGRGRIAAHLLCSRRRCAARYRRDPCVVTARPPEHRCAGRWGSSTVCRGPDRDRPGARRRGAGRCRSGGGCTRFTATRGRARRRWSG